MDERTEPRKLTIKQASERAGVSTSYIRRLCADGRLQAHRLDGWLWVLDVAAFERWLSERKPRGRPSKDG